MTIRGTAGDDNLTGTSGNDEFILWQGGNDTVHAGDGNDVMRLGNALTAADQLDSGDGRDLVILNGDYSAGLVVGANTITNVELLGLVGGHSYNLTMNDGNVAAGQKLVVQASGLGSGDTLTFDGSAESDGQFYVLSGAGDDVLAGGARNDVFRLEQGGSDTAHGGGGNDTFYTGESLWSDDRIDGGAGYDKVFASGFAGGDAITFMGTTMQGVEDFVLSSGSGLGVTTDDATVAAGAAMIIDASAVNGFFFDGSAETDGRFTVLGSAGDDDLTGGAKRDVFHLENGGIDTVHGGGGNDTFYMGGAFAASDTIDGGSGLDTLAFSGSYAALAVSDTNVTGIETLSFQGASSVYSAVSVSGDVAGGATLHIDASTAASLDLDLTNATSSAYAITGSGGNDTIRFGVLTIDDTINGGAGDNTLYISGDVGSDTLVLNPDTLTNIDQLIVAGDAKIEILLDDATIAAGQTMTFDGSAVATERFSVDGELETDGHLNITGGGAYGILVGGALSDTITTSAHTSWYEVAGLGGADTINLASGEDDVVYQDVSDSTGTVHDVVSGFDAGEDFFIFVGTTVGGFDGVLTGSVSAATLDSDLHGITSDALGADHAWEVDVTSGDLSDHQFLIVDVNGNAQYDAGSDYLIDISGHTGTLSMANFI